MGDTHHHHRTTGAATSSRLGMRGGGGGGGEIVEVQGGHIMRSTGRKDRHSKVCTAKGPRDRRVRLSAHTAIQFYDVQDRLGYDRPSKAVDWLIKKAKAAIDELAELPSWKPTASGAATTQQPPPPPPQPSQTEERESLHQAVAGDAHVRSLQHQQQEQQINDDHQPNSGPAANASSFLPPSLDSDSIADTIKSFFPMGVVSGDTPQQHAQRSIQFESFHQQPPDLLSRTTSGQSQDLRLSLQSFQDPVLMRPQSHDQHVAFTGTPQLVFDSASAANSALWSSDHNTNAAASEIGRFQRIAAWNAGGGGSGGGGFMFASAGMPQAEAAASSLFGGQSQFFSQRGPLQSSNMPAIRAWMEPALSSDHHHHQQIQHSIHSITPGSALGFASGGFSGYHHIPARIQGQDGGEHGGILDKPSSASSDSHH